MRKRNSLVLISIIILLASATYILSGGFGLSGNPIPEEPVKSEKTYGAAPDFEFTDLKGNTSRLSDFQGKVVVLNFWASWCAPCVVEFPQLLNLANTFPDELVLLAISLDEDQAAMMRFLEKMDDINQDNVIIARDPDKRISLDLFQTVKLPETFLIRPDGEIIDKIIGASVVFDSPGMKARIRTLYDDS